MLWDRETFFVGFFFKRKEQVSKSITDKVLNVYFLVVVIFSGLPTCRAHPTQSKSLLKCSSRKCSYFSHIKVFYPHPHPFGNSDY